MDGRQPSWIAWDDEPKTSPSKLSSSPTRSPHRSRRRLGMKKKEQGNPQLAKEDHHHEDDPVKDASTAFVVVPKALFPHPEMLSTVEQREIDWERQYLMKICAEGGTNINWQEMLDRIQACPKAVWPVLLFAPGAKPSSAAPSPQTQEVRKPRDDPSFAVYEATVLGALCAMHMAPEREGDDTHTTSTGTTTTTTSIHDVIGVVLELCPWQASCSQRIPGHTPLRVAVRNPSCTPRALEMLVQADRSGLNERDRDGLSPVDHLLQTVQLGPCHEHAVERLRSLLKHGSPAVGDVKSPLLLLLSLGTSFGALAGETASIVPILSSCRIGAMEQKEVTRLPRILACCQILLQWNPALISVSSQTTGCSPLHVAIRNYGNFAPLIRELIEHDVKGALLRQKNHFGDLPLHVASSVGVPMDIMRLVLARTLMATSGSGSSQQQQQEPHPLVWSTNSSNFTPVDLEWIRHIEAGHGFFSHRSFYPLDTRGVRRPGGRYDDLYHVLLREAVEQTKRDGTPARRTSADQSAAFSSADDSSVGLLLHRIFLIIRASFRDSFSRSPFDLSGDILHQACALSGPNGPTLPLPVLELILWQHPEQMRRDHAGKLPLHYALQVRRLSHEVATAKASQEWKSWVQQLLRHAPDSCRVADNQGRLAIHHVLDYPNSNSTIAAIRVQEARVEVVEALASSFPQSVDVVDPVTMLYPFELAAVNPLVSLDSVYCLLRKSPGVAAHRTPASNEL